MTDLRPSAHDVAAQAATEQAKGGSAQADAQIAPHVIAASAPAPGDVELRRRIVLDTSVLLSDPRAVFRFDEHDVVLPLVVVIELEAKRTHPELGYFARQALRLLDDFRIEHGRLDERIPLNEQGGTLRVELNHSDMSRLPTGMQLGDNDTRISTCPLTPSLCEIPCHIEFSTKG